MDGNSNQELPPIPVEPAKPVERPEATQPPMEKGPSTNVPEDLSSMQQQEESVTAEQREQIKAALQSAGLIKEEQQQEVPVEPAKVETPKPKVSLVTRLKNVVRTILNKVSFGIIGAKKVA